MTKDEALKMAIEFIDEITNAAGKYPYVDKTSLVADSYAMASKLKEALEQPLTRDWKETIDERIAKDNAFKQALEQPAQEIVRKVFDIDNFHSSVLDRIKFTSPQQWQGLSDDEISKVIIDEQIPVRTGKTANRFARAIEQALKEKNHA